MNTGRSIGLVALRELRERGLSRSYLISWLVLVLIIGAGFVLPSVLANDNGTRTYQVGLVGSGSGGSVEAALGLISDSGEPIELDTASFADRPAALQAVTDHTIDVALVDGAELIVHDSTAGELQRLLQQAVRSVRVEGMIVSGEVSEEAVALLSGDALAVTSAVPQPDEDAADRRFLIGQAALVLLMMAIMMTGSWVLLGVTEEKTSRVVEVLLSTIRPWHLLSGKIIGVGILGLLQFAVVVTGLIVGVRITFGPDIIPEVDLGLLATLFAWFVLGYTVYAIGYAAVGAIASRPEDAQNAAFPMTMVALAGYFAGLFYVGRNPDSTLSVVLTLFPPTAPFVLPIRAIADSVPLWEHLAAVALMIGFAILLIRWAGRIYSGGVFKYQSRVKLRDAFRSAEF